MPKCKVLTKPLSDLVSSETFFETHPQYSLKPEAVGQIKASPCSLILALIYLDLLKELDSQYVRRVPPSDLLLVAMVRFQSIFFIASPRFFFPSRLAACDCIHKIHSLFLSISASLPDGLYQILLGLRRRGLHLRVG